MKSIALSLLVALGVSLGASSALAETRMAAPSSSLSAATEAMQNAKLHADRAEQYRAAARAASEKAKIAQQIVENDLKQGFTYEAGVMKLKVQKYQQEAAVNLVYAASEDALAAQYRAQARSHMAAYQGRMGTVSR